ncbi:glycosyltransferase family 4 protein [Tunturiibacter gelidoferens]|uniref:Glycosyltransferase involved in cell wall biosynthesis n=1 Tax=Tunturiibacter gelidiferens TaxID=3069689 RepID=A0A9X0U6C4_9BACT|nr:glycosyltransferase family 4 protein [Edaphobacter lichenicola]MBB5329662.1 glycosyltransferase involved in cell wall biosynthesis [Edaphobacter lichenicola]
MNEDTRQPTVFMMDLWATVPYYTAYLSKALLTKSVNVTVGSISYYLDPKCFSSRGIKLDPGLMDAVGRFRLPRLPRRVLKLLESLLNLAALSVRFVISPPDIVHVQFLSMLTQRMPFDLWFVLLCQRRGSKIVLTVHDLLPHNTGQSHKRIFHHLYQMVDRIICHSDTVRERLTEEFAVPVEKVSVIAHGPFFYDLPVTPEQILQSFALDPRKLLVLWQGIISPYKGIDLLLEAWQHVEATTEQPHLLIAGTGSPQLLEQIREQIRRLNLQRVELHPRFISAEELVALYRAADIVVYPYRAITTSGALATGLALCKTIVASDLPVFRELLTDKENALLVDPQDSLALANALTDLSKDAPLRAQLAENVRSMNFGEESWLSIATKTIECYTFVQRPQL